MTARLITIAVFGCAQPFGFARAVRSAFAQRGHRCALEVVAIDADPAGASLAAARAVAPEATTPFLLRHMPRADAAALRLAALDLARGDLVGFLDEVCEAPQTWLAALAEAHAGARADAAAGAILAAAPAAAPRLRAALEALRSAPPPGPDRLPADLRGALVSKQAARAALAAAERGPGDLDPLALGLARIGATITPAAHAWIRVRLDGADLSLAGALNARVAAARAGRRLRWEAGAAPHAGAAPRLRARPLRIAARLLAAAELPLAWMALCAGFAGAPEGLVRAADAIGALAPAPGEPRARPRRPGALVPANENGAPILPLARRRG